jgi:lysophospholipase L1-like esterase
MSWVGSVLGKQSYMDFVNRHVLDTNAWIREVARREGIVLLDLEAVLSNGPRRRRAYTAADGSHLTAAAYDALSRYAESVLR